MINKLITYRVLGVTRLRVVDASIMPHPTNAQLASAVMVIAEKSAHEILKVYD